MRDAALLTSLLADAIRAERDASLRVSVLINELCDACTQDDVDRCLTRAYLAAHREA